MVSIIIFEHQISCIKFINTYIDIVRSVVLPISVVGVLSHLDLILYLCMHCLVPIRALFETDICMI